jgi:sulfofructose kinase
MSKILGLGGVTVDQIGVVEHVPGPDEVVRLQEYHVEQGGMVATAMVAAARLGAKPEFIGAVGDDANGRLILQSFAGEGVAAGAVQVIPGGISAFSFILVEQHSGKRTIIHEPGVQQSRTLNGLPEDPKRLLSGVGYLHLDGFWMDTAVTMAESAKEAEIQITLDIGQNQRDPKIENLLALADYVIPSLTFARRFTGRDEVQSAAEGLLGYGAKAVIQTLGEQGAFVIAEDGRSFTVPAFAVEVVDTTGAGDSFHGGFLFALSRGFALKEAVEFASAVAALKCTRLGGQSGLPSLSQVMGFLSERGIKLS